MYAFPKPSAGIPQPPHSAGEAYRGLRARIDPSQIPSPVDAIEADRDEWENQTYATLSGKTPPLSTTDYVALDQGNASPRHLRLTTTHIPASAALARECGIPLGGILQPFADGDPPEEPVPLVDFGEAGPPRCRGCRAYVSPWAQWTAGGARWRCMLCAEENEVLPEYFCNLDANLQRLDALQRPELCRGTVDFRVSSAPAYHTPPALAPFTSDLSTPLYVPPTPPRTTPRAPGPIHMIFALDTTADAVNSGFLRAACDALRGALYGGVREDGSEFARCVPREARIGVVSFDRSVAFWELSPNLREAPMRVVADVDEPFVPVREGLFCDPDESKHVLDALLRDIPGRLANAAAPANQSALGAAILGGLAALTPTAGHILTFLTSPPTLGPGAMPPASSLLAADEEARVYGTDREKTLFTPRNEAWRAVAEACKAEGVGVSVWVGGRGVDLGSLGIVPGSTGGDVHLHARFDPARDGRVLEDQVRRALGRTTVYDGEMVVRCSRGLKPTAYTSLYAPSPSSTSALPALSIPYMHADSTLSFGLAHTGIGVGGSGAAQLDPRGLAHVQAAVLHTTAAGERRVRVVNASAQVAEMAGNVYIWADVEGVVCVLARECATQLQTRQVAHIKEDLSDRCASILLGYRRNCAAATSPSQLIIPEAFRALPVYTLGITKNKAFKGRTVPADVRNAHAHFLRGASVRSTMQHLYPRVLALHDLDDVIALPDPDPARGGAVSGWPALMRAGHEWMEAGGVYLADNEKTMIFWIGSSVSPQVMHDLFGVDEPMAVDPFWTELPVLQTRLSAQVRNILAHRAEQRGYTPRIAFVRQNIDGGEIEFADMLVEDQNNGAMSYMDYLCLVHKQISTALTNGGTIGGGAGMRAPW
ncbi:hypothetical protein CONPUDRAFT_108653 [Coniophora puteana RWD-64-598 SS2]|uniref:Uncharacterized protein n=1 Tax=Coniophora puteana (strain RWD-64-598) TaxID=741705 RepID=A0A5M3MHG9_CONPW|nr:uncharacterized protein CONPUDRAFT_108653 [Coniophora puteana RWD-64-598 SS2]EIW78679.1 hypothetical protein CONPUDRAFT_108653 [Coniophora puteana RWD-64-598 SS2]